ncbi:MAG TPA: hypothetical protein VFC78_25140 [Tepidisphaeraceae bacterium]|nr:hypothetical protein [Tepidisphaeraceae bacterium]
MTGNATLKVSGSLFHQIEERARERGISVDNEAAELLAKALAFEAEDAELLAEIRKDREQMAQNGVFLTDEFLDRAKRWGRE